MSVLPLKLFCVTKLCYKYYDYITIWQFYLDICTNNTLLTFLLLREHNLTFGSFTTVLKTIFIIARKYTEVWPATLWKMFCESWRVLMLVLKCLKALGTMLFARFAWIVFRRKIFLILTVLRPWYKPQFEYQICIFRFSTLFFIHSLWY